FNLAGYGIDPAERDAEGAYQINAHLVGAIGEAMAEVRDPAWPGQDLVHAGSALEYGDVGGNLAEDCDPEPTTLYGQSKLAGTQSLSRCCADRGLRGLTARLFTVYGPGEHPGRLLPSLVRAARTGEPLGLTAGRQRRDFTFVADVAEGLLRLGLTRARPGDIVNLATGRLVTVRQFAETAARLLGMPDGRLRFGALPTRPAEMNHGPVNLDRLRGLIGWTPPTEVTDGILSTVAFEASSQSREAGHARSK
ncbi:MAG: NAD-dependent epimerase/dehydratase family protein, partial [Candidatus Rokuibacteriota bacterium]